MSLLTLMLRSFQDVLSHELQPQKNPSQESNERITTGRGYLFHKFNPAGFLFLLLLFTVLCHLHLWISSHIWASLVLRLLLPADFTFRTKVAMSAILALDTCQRLSKACSKIPRNILHRNRAMCFAGPMRMSHTPDHHGLYSSPRKHGMSIRLTVKIIQVTILAPAFFPEPDCTGTAFVLGASPLSGSEAMQEFEKLEFLSNQKPLESLNKTYLHVAGRSKPLGLNENTKPTGHNLAYKQYNETSEHMKQHHPKFKRTKTLQTICKQHTKLHIHHENLIHPDY